MFALLEEQTRQFICEKNKKLKLPTSTERSRPREDAACSLFFCYKRESLYTHDAQVVLYHRSLTSDTSPVASSFDDTHGLYKHSSPRAH